MGRREGKWWVIRYLEDGTEEVVDGYFDSEFVCNAHLQEIGYQDGGEEPGHDLDMRFGDPWTKEVYEEVYP